MSESARPSEFFTVEEYLAFEETSAVKHEYVGGRLYAMTGTTKRHNRIVFNIARKLDDATEGNSCRVFFEAIKLRVSGDVFYYPDVMVACEPDEDPLIEENPCLVVEVLSPNTEATDRREKLLAYRNLESLRAYLIVGTERRWIERHFLADDGTWRHEEHLGEGGIPIPCPPEASLTLDDVYRRIEFTE
jgi:Uma2 family endonuclease